MPSTTNVHTVRKIVVVRTIRTTVVVHSAAATASHTSIPTRPTNFFNLTTDTYLKVESSESSIHYKCKSRLDGQSGISLTMVQQANLQKGIFSNKYYSRASSNCFHLHEFCYSVSPTNVFRESDNMHPSLHQITNCFFGSIAVENSSLIAREKLNGQKYFT